jgi:hypothetical protein
MTAVEVLLLVALGLTSRSRLIRYLTGGYVGFRLVRYILSWLWAVALLAYVLINQ